jgi:hypothetical protein
MKAADAARLYIESSLPMCHRLHRQEKVTQSSIAAVKLRCVRPVGRLRV